MPHSPISLVASIEEEEPKEEESFEEEELLEDEESPEGVNDEGPADSSLYPDSSSSDDPTYHTET